MCVVKAPKVPAPRPGEGYSEFPITTSLQLVSPALATAGGTSLGTTSSIVGFPSKTSFLATEKPWGAILGAEKAPAGMGTRTP